MTVLSSQAHERLHYYRAQPKPKFTERKLPLQKNNKVRKKILPFVITYHPALPNLKNILMSKWHLIQDQPLPREIYNEPPIISYKRAKSLGDILVRATM